MIRAFQGQDTARVMQIWLSGNEGAHPFIPAEYWRAHQTQVQRQILQAEVYVCESEGAVQGFIGLAGDYIAGIFVAQGCRSRGMGGRLLAYAKQRHGALSLNVYQKNTRAVSFYLRQGFLIQSAGVDGDTGEAEYTMLWKSSGRQAAE